MTKKQRQTGVRYYDSMTGKTVPPPARERGTPHCKGTPPPPRPPESPGFSTAEKDYLKTKQTPLWRRIINCFRGVSSR